MGNCRFFAGGNTADGFVSFFPYVLPAAECSHMYYIKGGPGVGKSSMMKQIGSLMTERGCYVEYFDCSGDPDSVDGITISTVNRSGENVKIGFIDATAPHSYDPVVPGARDTLVNLGDYLDESALEPYQNEIQRLVNKCSSIYRKCYAYLNAASSVLRTAPQYERNDKEVCKFVNELTEWSKVQTVSSQSCATTIAKALSCDNEGLVMKLSTTNSVRHLFAEAYTHKGFISHLDTLPCQKQFAFNVPIGLSVDPLLQALLENLLVHEIEVIALHEPLRPALLKHLYLPREQILFYTADNRTADERKTKDRELYDTEVYENLISYAVRQLQQAKATHDELEAYYVKNMDFTGWCTRLDSILLKMYNQIER